MNKRIRKLAELCGFSGNPDDYSNQSFDIDKFAQLIIEECASVAFQLAPSDESACEISSGIEQHFGIE